jgi:dihydrodipicolinate reductase
MAEPIKVAIAGINGKFGRASAAAILADPELKLVGAFGRDDADYIGKDVAEVAQLPGATGIKISKNAEECFAGSKPDVLLDFTLTQPAVENAKYALSKGVRPVVGTSGIEPKFLEEIGALARNVSLGAMVVPNFSVGAVLMMEFAKQAGKHFSNVEVIEMHHTRKHDAPSGTAMHTARKLASNDKKYNVREVPEHEILPGSRGGEHESGVRIHSLRLPGLISHQNVIFGSDGELLSVNHDSFNTNAYTRGILMSIKGVMGMKDLVVGLEHLL